MLLRFCGSAIPAPPSRQVAFAPGAAALAAPPLAFPSRPSGRAGRAGKEGEGRGGAVGDAAAVRCGGGEPAAAHLRAAGARPRHQSAALPRPPARPGAGRCVPDGVHGAGPGRSSLPGEAEGWKPRGFPPLPSRPCSAPAVPRQVQDNVERFFTRFVEEGKATVRLKEPAVDVCLSKVRGDTHRQRPGLKRTTVLIPFQPPAMCRVANQQPRLPRATSSLALNACRDGASTASLGNLFQCVNLFQPTASFQSPIQPHSLWFIPLIILYC